MFCVCVVDGCSVGLENGTDEKKKKKNFHARKLQEDATRQKRESETRCPVIKSVLEIIIIFFFSRKKIKENEKTCMYILINILFPSTGILSEIFRWLLLVTLLLHRAGALFRRSIDRVSIALPENIPGDESWQTTSDGNKTHFNSNSTSILVAYKKRRHRERGDQWRVIGKWGPQSEPNQKVNTRGKEDHHHLLFVAFLLDLPTERAQ